MKNWRYYPQIPNALHGTEMRHHSEMEDDVYENLDTIKGASVASPVPISPK